MCPGFLAGAITLLAIFIIVPLMSPAVALAGSVGVLEPYGTWTITGTLADNGTVSGTFTIYETFIYGSFEGYSIPYIPSSFSVMVSDPAIIPNGFNPLAFNYSTGSASLIYGSKADAEIDFFTSIYYSNQWVNYELQLFVNASALGLPTGTQSDPPINSGSNFSNGSISTGVTGSVDPVPEPCTMLLLGSGLVGLASWKFRKRS
jgi:hypothetical protein